MQQQISIISETIQNFNNSFTRINNNILTLNQNLKRFNQFTNQIKDLKTELDIETQLSSHLILLIKMTDELPNLLNKYVNDISLISNGIISYNILPPEQLFDELQKISTRYTLPIPLTIDNIYAYYKMIKLTFFIKDNLLVISFKVPITNFTPYNIYEIFPLPTPHKQDTSLFSYIESSKQFLLVSHSKSYYLALDNLNHCKEYLPSKWICTNVVNTLKNTNSKSCEIELFMGTSTIPKVCKIRSLIANLKIWHKIEENKWIYSVSVPTQLSIVCEDQPTKVEVITKLGTVQHQSQFKAFTANVNLEVTSTITAEQHMSIFPLTDISEDDCCKKLKHNISIEAINLESIKLVDLDLKELKFAQHKL